ncbi:MAG TPA: UvrD-helicase domain-containing protein, partial [Methanocorpusculum sp.]|nr:UvrD-helicase domain-containing protein [Methanocorpusculum sp.]
RNVLDFSDLLWLTYKIIDEKDVLTELQKRYSYFLIDEVQDTDQVQSDIIWKIIGSFNKLNGSIFIVGDIKQSIYGFRDADICIMESMQNDIITNNGKEVVLDVNFRSTKEILGFVNVFFSKLFSENGDRWDIPYHPIYVSPARSKDCGSIQILRTIQTDYNEKPDDIESKSIAQKIHEIVNSNLMIHGEDGNDRPVSFRDIAILLETRKSLHFLEQHLRNQNIPYCIPNGQGFYQSREVRDMINLLSVVSKINDDVTLYGVLRSPYFGISDADLCMPTERYPGSYESCINEYAKDNPDSKIATAFNRIESWREFAQNNSIPDLIRTIIRESYIYTIYGSSPNGKYKIANIEKLISIAIARSHACNQILTLPEFIHIFNLGVNVNEKSATPVGNLNDDQVNIMTIHASKGLEFPIVILANLHHPIPSDKNTFVLDKEMGIGLSIRVYGDKPTPTFVSLFNHDSINKRSIAERKRLFYVAMTRARDHLILSYVKELGKNFPEKSICKSRICWLNKLLPLDKPQTSYQVQTNEENIPIIDIPVTEIRADSINSDNKDKTNAIPEIKEGDKRYIHQIANMIEY